MHRGSRIEDRKRNTQHLNLKTVVALLMALTIAGCATMSWQPTAVTGYEATGATLAQLHATAVQLKAAGKLTTDQVAQFNKRYQDAVQLYETIGDSLSLAIQAQDAASQKQLTDHIQELTFCLANVIAELTEIIQGAQ